MSKLKPPKKVRHRYAKFKEPAGEESALWLKAPPDSSFCTLAFTLGDIAARLKKSENDRANAEAAVAEAHHKPRDVFAAGNRVVMRGAALIASGQYSGADCARVWTIIKCGCDLCRQAPSRLVAVDQEVEGYGWRHIAVKALRHYGQPAVDELPVEASDRAMTGIQRGMRRAAH